MKTITLAQLDVLDEHLYWLNSIRPKGKNARIKFAEMISSYFSISIRMSRRAADCLFDNSYTKAGKIILAAHYGTYIYEANQIKTLIYHYDY